jgi:hypothetical protein
MQIRKTREGWYIGLAFVQLAIFLILVGLHEVSNVDHDGKLKTLLNIGGGFAPFVIISLADSLIIIEGVAMLAERYLKGRYQDGKREGQQEERRAWEAWNQRREQAVRDGQEFTESPPSAPQSDKNA